ncbi:hypothetical protein [Nocardioides sp.]|uniref:hypothetical protein n=1 Tax=Nocardioides sp. TaxID=35761 RepID=UPI002F40697B
MPTVDREQARARLSRAVEEARSAGDTDALGAAALALAATHRFGTHPGRLPAHLYEAYAAADGPRRIGLAAALARIWAYGGEADRGLPFATEAVAAADEVDDPVLLADALDALLTVRWGPDDLDVRVSTTARLEDTVALVPDPQARLTAYLWRLTTTLETLDLVATRRMLRALEDLAVETGSARVRLFAESRLGMAAALRGDAEEVEARLRATRTAAEESGEVDGYALERVLSSALARLRGDIATLALEAAIYDEFGTTEAVPSILAEGALLWLEVGESARARSAMTRLGPLSSVPRDLDWLLTVSSMTMASARMGVRDLTEEGLDLLTPYAGRGIVNAGAVAFAGTVDEVLHLATRSLGRPEADTWRASAGAGYARLGATWWEQRLGGPSVPAESAPRATVYLHPAPDGLWTVGVEGRTTRLRDQRGLHHVRALLRRPGVDVAAVALVGAHDAPHEDRDDLVDAQALRAYRDRLDALDAELDEARSWDDAGRVTVLTEERDALLDHVRTVTGLGGASRRTTSTGERARVSVRKAIVATLDRVETADPWLGRLLRDRISTGGTCVYEPDPDRPVTWVLDGGEPSPSA